ncbi:hypothetical protein LBMAG56_28760 [Verrucomicrobiota bacterium]|nr:hypothetical protein LBMAG56_28760 [Verrucomicrobiota bacterium]
MPLGPFESEVLRLLAGNRNPDSYVGGATVLHQAPDSPRASADIDVFHDTAPAVHDAATRDTATLQAAGYDVRIVSRQECFCRAIVTQGPATTKLEWVQDSAFRFFPVESDPQLGWRLHFWDVATNKILAFCGREKLRDWLDVIYLHERHLCLGALVWAAAAKDPGLTPEFLLDAAKRFVRFPFDLREWSAVGVAPPPDLGHFKRRFLTLVDEAAALVAKLPPLEMGCLYLDASGKPVCPDPSSPEFPKLTRHFGSVKGAWPRIVEN